MHSELNFGEFTRPSLHCRTVASCLLDVKWRRNVPLGYTERAKSFVPRYARTIRSE